MIIDNGILEACASYLLDKMKISASSSEKKGQMYGRKTERIVSVTKEQLISLLIKNGFKCAVTGISFPKFSKKYYYKTAKSRGVNPCILPSVDRIDSNKDYTWGNIEIVCSFYNFGKSSNTKENALEIINFLKQNNKVMNSQETINNGLLGYLIDIGDFVRAEKYFGGIGLKVVQTTTAPKVAASSASQLAYKTKYDKFMKLVKPATSEEVEGMIDISEREMYRGAINSKKLIQSKLATKIINIGATIYSLELDRRGYRYFIGKAEFAKINLADSK